MQIIKHTSSNDVVAHDGGECQPAPCTSTIYAGVKTITTYWKPSPREAETLARGGLIRVEGYAGHMPPFSVMVEGA